MHWLSATATSPLCRKKFLRHCLARSIHVQYSLDCCVTVRTGIKRISRIIEFGKLPAALAYCRYTLRAKIDLAYTKITPDFPTLLTPY